MITNEIIEKAKRVKVFVVDIDGVMTDGRIIYSGYGFSPAAGGGAADGVSIFWSLMLG